MIIEKKGSGPTIPYGFGYAPSAQSIAMLSLDSEDAPENSATEAADIYDEETDTLIFGEAEENFIIVDLAARQQDSAVCVDVYVDGNGTYTEEPGDYYAANVLIPPKRYRYVDTGEVDENERPIVRKEALPLDKDAVTLVLWALPEFAQKAEPEIRGV